MAFSSYDPILGTVDLSTVDINGPGVSNLVAGTGSGRQTFANEVIRGYDAKLGAGEFIYAAYASTIAVGTVCTFVESLVNGLLVSTAVAWAGTANSGSPIGVSVAGGVAGQFGWFQVEGNAIVAVTGAPVSGNSVYFVSAGTVSPTLVASKQVVGAQFASAPGITLGAGSTAQVLTSTQAVVLLNRPYAQGNIT